MKTKLTVLFLSAILLTSCTASDKYTKSDFFAMNTYVTMSAENCPEELLEQVHEHIMDYERHFSATISDSFINTLDDGDIISYQNGMELLTEANKISNDTNGAFDYTLGTLIRLWDICGDDPHVPDEKDIDIALLHCGYEKTFFDGETYHVSDDGLCIDLGAITKGYAGQKETEFLRQNGIENAAISLGGNVSAIGSSERVRKCGEYGWNISITDPFDTGSSIGDFLLCDATISVSGGYERFFTQDGKRYHHIIDRNTGYPSQSDLEQVAVISPDGICADALSTALFVMGYQKALEFYQSGKYDFEAVFCLSDKTVIVTDGFTEKFNPNKKDGFSFPQYE